MSRSFLTDPPRPLNPKKKPPVITGKKQRSYKPRKTYNRLSTDAPALEPDAVSPGAARRDPKRRGAVTGAEKAMVKQFVGDLKEPATKAQVRALATLTRRTPLAIKRMIEEARQQFIGKARRYVEIHGEAVEEALQTGDLEQAIKGSQWAITNLSAEGVRIVDKPNADAGGTKVMIGVQIGGIDKEKVIVGQIAPSTPLDTFPDTPIEEEEEMPG